MFSVSVFACSFMSDLYTSLNFLALLTCCCEFILLVLTQETIKQLSFKAFFDKPLSAEV